MDWSDAVMPLVVAVIGVIAVTVGAWLAARSALRVRLMDMVREDARDHRDYQVRAVAAVNALGTASAHLIRARLAFLRQQRDAARTEALAMKAPATITMEGPFDLSPDEDKRVARATDEWRFILAEGHAFASEGTGLALQGFDAKRSELVSAVNEALTQIDVSDAIRGLEVAQSICDDLRGLQARSLYRELQIEKVAGAARVFRLAHIRRLRSFAKQVARMHEADIERAQAGD